MNRGERLIKLGIAGFFCEIYGGKSIIVDFFIVKHFITDGEFILLML